MIYAWALHVVMIFITPTGSSIDQFQHGPYRTQEQCMAVKEQFDKMRFVEESLCTQIAYPQAG